MGARTKWSATGCAPKLSQTVLQQPLRPKTCHRINNRHRFPPEQPTGHRKANRCIAQMHHSHNTPPTGWSIHRGRNHMNLYRHNSNGPQPPQGTSVPSKWHGSNSRMALHKNPLKTGVRTVTFSSSYPSSCADSAFVGFDTPKSYPSLREVISSCIRSEKLPNGPIRSKSVAQSSAFSGFFSGFETSGFPNSGRNACAS